MDVRFINRYHSYCASLAALEKAKGRDPEDEFVLSGTVQKFALTFDISWKVMKDIIVKYHKIQSFEVITGEYIPLFQRFREEAGKFVEQE